MFNENNVSPTKKKKNMATDILSMPQIEVTKQDMLQNDMHIGQGADISRRLQNAR